MARTAKQAAALRKAQAASARKRKGRKKPTAGKIYTRSNNWVKRGKTKPRRAIRAVGLGYAVGYTGYGFAYIGSGIRKHQAKKNGKPVFKSPPRGTYTNKAKGRAKSAGRTIKRSAKKAWG